MNKQKLQECINYRIRLRPPAMSVLDGMVVDQRDDVWMVESVTARGVATVRNISTHHTALLGADHIHHFDSDPVSETDGFRHGFFTLTVQVFMSGNRLWVEPIGLRG